VVVQACPPSPVVHALIQPQDFHVVQRQEVGSIKGGGADGVPAEIGREHGSRPMARPPTDCDATCPVSGSAGLNQVRLYCRIAIGAPQIRAASY